MSTDERLTREECHRQAVSYLHNARTVDSYDVPAVNYLVSVAAVWAQLALSAEPADPHS